MFFVGGAGGAQRAVGRGTHCLYCVAPAQSIRLHPSPVRMVLRGYFMYCPETCPIRFAANPGVPRAAAVRWFRLGDGGKARLCGRHQRLLGEHTSYLGGTAGVGSPHPKLACSALPTINNILCGSGVGTHQPEGAIIRHRRHCYIWLQNQSPVWE